MPIPRLIASPILGPRNIRAISLFHVVISYHVNQPTQARTIDPEPVRNRLDKFSKRRLLAILSEIPGTSVNITHL